MFFSSLAAQFYSSKNTPGSWNNMEKWLQVRIIFRFNGVVNIFLER